MLDAVLADIASTQSMDVTLTASSREKLRKLCLADLSNGGRGIRNKVEKHLINPLARALFDVNAMAGEKLQVEGVLSGNVTTLSLVKAISEG